MNTQRLYKYQLNSFAGGCASRTVLLSYFPSAEELRDILAAELCAMEISDEPEAVVEQAVQVIEHLIEMLEHTDVIPDWVGTDYVRVAGVYLGSITMEITYAYVPQ